MRAYSAALAAACCAAAAALAAADDTMYSQVPVGVKGRINTVNGNEVKVKIGETMTFSWAVLDEANPPDWASNPEATIEVRLCFAPESKKDRPWRKFKDLIRKDNQCKKKVVKKDKGVLFSTGSVEWVLPKRQPGATYFARFFVHTPEQSFVSMGASGEPAGGSDPETFDCSAVEGTDYECEYYQTEQYDGTSTGLYVAIGICAAIGPIALAIAMFLEGKFKLCCGGGVDPDEPDAKPEPAAEARSGAISGAASGAVSANGGSQAMPAPEVAAEAE